jgi:hypothetical protein
MQVPRKLLLRDGSNPSLQFPEPAGAALEVQRLEDRKGPSPGQQSQGTPGVFRA